VFAPIRDGAATIKRAVNNTIDIDQLISAGKFGTGDYYVLFEDGGRCKISANTDSSIEISSGEAPVKLPLQGGKIEVQVRLQRPYIDLEKCIGCGVCEHECPVSGRRAVRISAEGETRSMDRRLLLKG
jgi:NAD-dependent dihydropyrimidine dehydrogenase PreA subunit